MPRKAFNLNPHLDPDLICTKQVGKRFALIDATLLKTPVAAPASASRHSRGMENHDARFVNRHRLHHLARVSVWSAWKWLFICVVFACHVAANVAFGGAL